MENNELLKAILSKLENMDNRFGNLEQGQQELKKEVEPIKNNIAELKKEVEPIRNNIAELKKGQNEIKELIKNNNVAIGDVLTERLEVMADNVQEIKTSIEVLDMISKRNLTEISKLKVVR